MDRTQKEELVTALHRTFEATNLVVVTHQTGLTVAEADELRTEMREAGAKYRVTKNRLARIALKGTKFQALEALFTGPTAIAFSSDPVAAAKVCVEFARKNVKLTIVGGSLDGESLDRERIATLAKLPSLDELRAGLIGLVQAPATKLARVTQAPAAQLARVLSAYGARDEAA